VFFDVCTTGPKEMLLASWLASADDDCFGVRPQQKAQSYQIKKKEGHDSQQSLFIFLT
jgi:hypothetical protein